MPLTGSLRRVPALWAGSLAVVIVTSTLAFAQLGGLQAPIAPRTRLEYHHQEVPATNLVTMLNDLDGQGWEIFQVIPTWTLRKDDNDDQTRLIPQVYEVLGRRPVRTAK